MDIVTNRVVRYNYGINVIEPFDANKHPEKHKRLDYVDGCLCADNNFKVLMKKNTPVKEGTVIKHLLYSPSFHENLYTSVFAATQAVQFVDEEGCEELCTIHIYNEDLEPHIGKRLDYELRFIFGRTEIGIEAEVKQTKTIFTASIEV